jgi:hypothetical protein
MDESPVLTALTEAEREQAMTRFRLLQPFLALTSLARARHSLRTAWRWVAQYSSRD